MRPYYPDYTSWFKSFFCVEPCGQVISGLYCVGHGVKSYFWYWEVNFEAGYYQDFKAVDLAVAKEVYREERFDLWDEAW